MALVPDLASVREGIGLLLDAVPELKRVERYERSDIGTNNLPCASIWLGSVTRPGYGQGETVLGQDDYDAVWTINVRVLADQPTAEVKAQQLYEVLIARLRNQLDDNPLIDPNGAGVVNVSSLDQADLLPPDEAASVPVFIAQFTLRTHQTG